MTQNQKQCLLAEHFGWTEVNNTRNTSKFYPGGEYSGIVPNIPKHAGQMIEFIPRYFSDLNILHPIELELADEVYKDYITYLTWIIEEPTERAIMTASASKRAEALGMALNLWDFDLPEEQILAIGFRGLKLKFPKAQYNKVYDAYSVFSYARRDELIDELLAELKAKTQDYLLGIGRPQFLQNFMAAYVCMQHNNYPLE